LYQGMTLADLTISHGYPFKRLIDDGKDICDLDRHCAMAWKRSHPHECDALLSWQCIALHYPGGWPAFIEEIAAWEKRDAIAA
jgi:hypothetical protein